MTSKGVHIGRVAIPLRREKYYVFQFELSVKAKTNTK